MGCGVVVIAQKWRVYRVGTGGKYAGLGERVKEINMSHVMSDKSWKIVRIFTPKWRVVRAGDLAQHGEYEGMGGVFGQNGQDVGRAGQVCVRPKLEKDCPKSA